MQYSTGTARHSTARYGTIRFSKSDVLERYGAVKHSSPATEQYQNNHTVRVVRHQHDILTYSPSLSILQSTTNQQNKLLYIVSPRQLRQLRQHRPRLNSGSAAHSLYNCCTFLKALLPLISRTYSRFSRKNITCSILKTMLNEIAEILRPALQLVASLPL